MYQNEIQGIARRIYRVTEQRCIIEVQLRNGESVFASLATALAERLFRLPVSLGSAVDLIDQQPMTVFFPLGATHIGLGSPQVSLPKPEEVISTEVAVEHRDPYNNLWNLKISAPGGVESLKQYLTEVTLELFGEPIDEEQYWRTLKDASSNDQLEQVDLPSEIEANFKADPNIIVQFAMQESAIGRFAVGHLHSTHFVGDDSTSLTICHDFALTNSDASIDVDYEDVNGAIWLKYKDQVRGGTIGYSGTGHMNPSFTASVGASGGVCTTRSTATRHYRLNYDVSAEWGS